MSYDALIAALQPLVQRVRTDVTAVKQADGTPWTTEPLTPLRLRHHLNGGPARGVCPIKEGENTTMVGLLDFDSHKGESSWPEMQAAASRVMDALRGQGLTPIPWRSSGGRGIHVYVLWDQPQDAYTVRQVLIDALATEGFKNGPKGVSRGEVEVFPKQDSVGIGRYGNQFILPLAGKSEPLDALDLEPMGRDPGCIVWLASPPLVKREKPAREPLEFSAAVDLAEFRSALDAIPNSGEHELDYDDWRNVVFAIHAVAGDDGHALAHEFSSRSGKYNPEFLDNRVWPYVRDREDGIGARTVYAMARAHGWGGYGLDPNEFDAQVKAAEAPTPEPEPSQPDEAAKPLKFQFQAAHEFAVLEDEEWLIEDVLPRAQLGVVYGASGSGKSFVTLDMVFAIARGVPWRGKAVDKARVAYICAEGVRGFRKRLVAYAQQNDIHLRDAALQVLGAAPNLLDVKDSAAVVAGVNAVGGADVIVVDTLAQTTPGGNENAGEDMGKALAHCRRIHEATGALVLLIHHSGKDQAKGARGWSGLRAACDAEFEVSDVGGVRCLRVTKSKDGDDTGKWGFSLTKVVVGQTAKGKDITSCVVVDAELPSAKGPSRKLGAIESLINDVIQEFAEAQTTGIEVDAVLDEVVRRRELPPEERKAARNNAARAFKNLVQCVANYRFDKETGTLDIE